MNRNLKPSIRNLVKALRHAIYCKERLVERRGPRGGKLQPFCSRCENYKMDFLWNPAMDRFLKSEAKLKQNVLPFKRPGQ